MMSKTSKKTQRTKKTTLKSTSYGSLIKEMGIRLADLRQQRKLSQGELVAQLQSGRKHGARADISRSTYSRIENGTTLMTIDVLYALLRYYNVSADYLLFGKENTLFTGMKLDRHTVKCLIDLLSHILLTKCN